MAILFSQSDGSDQHYDTYEEFEQAFILIKRLNGEKVPQDLLDEAKAKYGVKEPKPFQVQIDGRNFESAIREATRELAEALDETAKDRTPVSDECENPETEPKFEVGDKVRVVGNSSRHYVEVGEVREITKVDSDEPKYNLSNISCGRWVNTKDIELVSDSTEFRMGDLVKVLETFEDSFGDVARVDTIQEVVTKHDNNTVLGVGRVLIGDNLDKLQLVCRREDRKDIKL